MRIRILKLDESEYWTDEIRSQVKRIFGVYVFDPTWRVHLCEWTASYELHRLESQIDFHENTPESIQERIEDEVREAERFSDPVIYVHCHVIDRAERFSQGWFPKGSMGVHTMTGFGSGFEIDPDDPAERRRKEQRHDYAIEEAIEYCSINGV